MWNLSAAQTSSNYTCLLLTYRLSVEIFFHRFFQGTDYVILCHANYFPNALYICTGTASADVNCALVKTYDGILILTVSISKFTLSDHSTAINVFCVIPELLVHHLKVQPLCLIR